MESSNMKNMVVLKNLPSNIIEEAIVILKPNKKARKLEIIDKSKNINIQNHKAETKKYIVKEAEMLVSDYIEKIENNKKYIFPAPKLKKKYLSLKKYSLVVTVFFIISLIFNFF